MTTFELLAVAIGDRLIRAGQVINGRYSEAPDPETEETRLWARDERWRMHVEMFGFFGNQLQFSPRKMLAAGYCTRDTAKVYIKLLKGAGWLVTVPRSGTYWAAGRNHHALGAMLRHRMITLPYPIGQDPPELFHTRATATQKAQRSQTAQLALARSPA